VWKKFHLFQWLPTFFDAFLPLLILELFIPPLWNVHSSPFWVRRLITVTTIGATVFIYENTLINKSGTKLLLKQWHKSLSRKTCASYKYKVI